MAVYSGSSSGDGGGGSDSDSGGGNGGDSGGGNDGDSGGCIMLACLEQSRRDNLILNRGP